MSRRIIGSQKSTVEADRALVQAAAKKAGGQQGLARLFGVSQSAISEWGRTRGIPRHARARLIAYLNDSQRLRDKSAAEARVIHPVLSLLQRFQELLDNEGPDIAALPPSYRERYRDRRNEIASRVREETRQRLSGLLESAERELADFRARLLAESRAERKGDRR